MPHMIEIETKIPISDLAIVRDTLKLLDAEDLGNVQLADTYYVIPWWGSAANSIRIRESDAGESDAELTLKAPSESNEAAVSRREISVGIRDTAAMRQILDLLGMDVCARVGKSRERFELRGVPVYLDEVPGLGNFVEIGAPVHLEDVNTMRERIREVVALLELSDLEPECRSYLQLVLETRQDER